MWRLLLACSALVGVAFQQPLRRLPHAPGPVAAPSGERRRTAVVAPAKKRKRKSGAATGAPKAAPPAAPAAPAPAPAAPAPEAVAAKAKPAALRIKLPPLPEEIDASSTASMASPQSFPVASESPEGLPRRKSMSQLQSRNRHIMSRISSSSNCSSTKQISVSFG